MSERTDKIRQQQRQGKKLTNAELAAKFNELLTGHDIHHREQIGPCVYCMDCVDPLSGRKSVRLYHGKLNKEN